MRGGYSPAGDLVQAIGDAAEAQGRAIEAQRRLADMQAIEMRIEDLRMANAGNLAEKQALREALAKLDPRHPLLLNTMLREKIQEAGRKALSLTNDWDAAREAGKSFST
jgi:hypothetical protein